MSLLGHDALGHWALGHPPDASGNAAIIASVGAFALTGQASPFAFSAPESVGTFALAGIIAKLNISESAAVGTFALAGVAETFMVTEAESAGGIILALGVATVDLIGHPTPPAGGFIASGATIPLVVTLGPSIGAYTLSGLSPGYTRDFINWLKDGFAGSSWTPDAAPSPGWIAVNPQGSSWQDKSAPVPNWSSAAISSNAWTVDPAQAIPPPVSN